MKRTTRKKIVSGNNRQDSNKFSSLSTDNKYQGPQSIPKTINSNQTWANILKQKKTDDRNVPVKQTDSVDNLPVAYNPTGDNYLLRNVYTLWSHDVMDKNWDITSYQKICEIRNASEFWRLFNNFSRLDYKSKHFFLMKDNIEPIWEHPLNRNGGVCSLKVDLNASLNVWELLNVYMVCNILSCVDDDINGISICHKNSWALVKIWNGNSKNNLSQTMIF